MKTVLLAGGLGTRLAEETEVRPKPMVEIGGRPILWHIMNHYSSYGFHEFVVALGYKGEQIKRYFLESTNIMGSLTLDMAAGKVIHHDRICENWMLHLMDTGEHTNTGGRLKRLQQYLAGSGTFMLTYGDGLADVDLHALVQFHRQQGRIATLTAVRPPARFGSIVFEGEIVKQFCEKPHAGEGWINGGFLVLEPEVFDYLHGSMDSLEVDVLEHLAADRQLAAYRHGGFWQCMDTLRDKRYLDGLWTSGKAPWRLAA